MRKRWIVVGFVLLFFLMVALSPGPEENEKKTSSITTNTPISVPTSTVSTTTKTLNDQDQVWMSSMKSILLNENIDVVSIKVANGRDKGGTKTVIVAYKSNAESKNDIIREIARITAVFLATKKKGWDIDELIGIIADQEGNAVGMWYCKKEWADQYINGSLTMEEVGLKVLDTIQVL